MGDYVNPTNNFPVIAGEDIAVGELVSISSVDGRAYLACAGTGIEEMPALGIAETTVSAGSEIELKHWGAEEQSTVTLWPGYPVYLSNTPGAISMTAGNTSQIVGFASSATRWCIHIDLTAGSTHVSSSSSSSSMSSSSSSESSSSSSTSESSSSSSTSESSSSSSTSSSFSSSSSSSNAG